MKRFHLEVRVKPRPGLLDPQGKAVAHALSDLGYSGVADVRVGKILDVELDAASEDEARARGEEMCRKLLANPVTEDFEVTVAGILEDA
ncbi:phosphoribosylformylglycinamidine synthase subunit PurS [soil metagenome]